MKNIEIAPIPKTLPLFLWHFAKKHKWSFFGFMFVGLFWALNLSIKPYLMKVILDTISLPEAHSKNIFHLVWIPCALYVLLSCLMGLIFRLYDWLVIKTYPLMKCQITEEMYNYVQEHSYTYFQQNFSGSVANKINDMARSAITIFFDLSDYFYTRSLSLVVGSITLFLVNPTFGLVLICWVTLFLLVSYLLSKKAQDLSQEFSESRSALVGYIVDALSNILNVKLFARQKFESHRLKISLKDTMRKDQRTQKYLLKVKIFYTLSIVVLSASMMALLLYERSLDRVTVGDFALVLTLNMFMIEEVFQLANQLVPFSEEVGICRQALSIIAPKHAIVDHPDAKDLIVTQGKIVFDKVNFNYLPNGKFFVDKSVTIHPGEKIGLVGFSGSGKTTFVNLILRFFEVDSGQILIDGQDISKVTQESLRSQIALIPQDPLLFHRTLMENIRYGRLDATDEEVLEASKKAHCHEFIQKMDNTYFGLVGERGVKLSGGQRQRIAMARAILKNAPILILDEATSALDSVTEDYIQTSLKELMKDRVVIAIAHRLSTLYHMDRLLVFSGGKIIEEGKHQDLLKKGGYYAKLWSLQADGFLSNEVENGN